MEITRVTPSLPKRGRQPKGGQAPLTPMSGWIFLLPCRRTIPSHTPRGEPRRGSECPWPHRYPISVSSSVKRTLFLTKANFSFFYSNIVKYEFALIFIYENGTVKYDNFFKLRERVIVHFNPFLNFPFGTRISNFAPLPGSPVSVIRIPVYPRSSRIRNNPEPVPSP
jgi:hypothetical protein